MSGHHATPCATCRREVDHLIALDRAITILRAKGRTHRSVRSVLAHFIDIAGQVARRHRKHRADDHAGERRAAVCDLAAHLLKHANEGAAA